MITRLQISAARALLEWTQDDLAQASGVSKDMISKIESGKSAGSLKSIQSVEDALLVGGLQFTEKGGVEHAQETIKIHKGQKGFQDFMTDVYETCRDIGGDIYVTNVDENLFDKWAGEDFITNTYLKKMHALPEGQFKFHTILSEGDSYEAANTYSEYRTIPTEYWSPHSTYIYGNKMANIIFTENDVLVRVYDQKDFVDTQRKTALFIWNHAKKP